MAKQVDVKPLWVGPVHPMGPAAVITRRGAERLKDGSLWVYRSEVEQVQPGPGEKAVDPGSVVTVLDGRGQAVGSALYSSASQITLRMISAEPQVKREGFLKRVEDRLHAALALRAALAPDGPENDACRLVFSEADQLPGIVVDRYAELLIVQLLTQATAQDDVRGVLTQVLRERLSPASVLERPDPRIRVAEELPVAGDLPLFADREQAVEKTVFTINGLRFHYDAAAGQKTGAFLDQRLNYAAAAAHARGRALDVCTYQGGFALHLAQRCEAVTGVDKSMAALEVADRNLLLNPHLPAKVDWIEADAFDLLREFEGSGRKYETVVLDPPAFAKSKRAMEGAMRGYKELNLRALKMMASGGTLVTCSCSHHVSAEEFLGVVRDAAVDAKRRVQVVESRGAAPDHPAILTLPETSYLKCLVCRVE